MATLRKSPKTPFPLNPNPKALKVGDRVVTDFYPGHEGLIRTIFEIDPLPKSASGIGVRFLDKHQGFVGEHAILVPAERCLPPTHPHVK